MDIAFSITVWACIFFTGVVIGIAIANKIESPEFKSAKNNAFDMIYYDSMSRKYSAMMKELDGGDTTEYLQAVDKESIFRDKKASSKDAYEADAVQLSERERVRLDKYITELEDRSDYLIEIYDKE